MFANKLKLFILTLTLLLSSAAIAAGQDIEETSDTLFANPLLIESVTLQSASETSITLAISAQQTDGCDFPVQVVPDIADEGLFITIFREARQDVMCPAVMQSYQTELTIDGEFNLSAYRDDPLYIEINENAYWLRATDDDTPELVPGQRSPMVLESLAIRAENDELVISVQGVLGTGCNLPVIVHRQRALEYDAVRLSIAQALPADIMCTAMIRPYEAEIVLDDVDVDVPQMLIINGISVQYMPQISDQETEGDAMRVNAIIENATISVEATDPPRITLQVSGFHPDGCKMPVQIDHQVLGSTVQVDIYRLLPADVMCPQVLQPFEETIVLEDIALRGGVTFNINGKIIQQDL